MNLGKCGKIACSLLIFLSDGLLLTFLSYRKRRYAALLLSVCVLVASIGALLLYLESFSWALPYFTPIGYGLFACKCGILLALYGDYSRKGLAKLIPFAVALVIFTTWYPLNAIWGAYLFGMLYWLYNFLPKLIGITNVDRTSSLWQMIPYIVTILVLVGVSLRRKRESQPPASLGLAYFREER